MKSAHYSRALLTLSLLGCGARTSLELGDAYGAGAGGPFMQGGGGNAPQAGAAGSSGSGASGGFAPHGGAAGGGAPPSGGAAGSGAGAGFGGSVSCMPTGPERCDGVDNDCNGVIDEGKVCPCDTRAFGNRSYLFCRMVDDWAGARVFCGRLGYHLASIRNASEDHWLEQTVNTFANAKWWIGLNDLSQEGHFSWVDGTPVGYEHFGAGEPNNAGGNENCVELNRFGVDGGWNDEPCDGALPFVCESEPTAN
jgi:hypothetical protein